MNDRLYGQSARGAHTGSANTPLSMAIPPSHDGLTCLLAMQYANAAAATVNGVTAMLTLGRTKVAEDAASGQPRLKLAAEPGPSGNALAANDILCVRNVNGAIEVLKISNGSYADCNATANLSANVALGADAWFFGVAGDTDPKTGEAHQVFRCAANGTTSLPAVAHAGTALARSHGQDEPIVLQSNMTNGAGTFDVAAFGYVKQ